VIVAPEAATLDSSAMAEHVGIIGCSAPGAALCFETICTEAPQRLGPYAHPEVTMHALDFAEHMAFVQRRDWGGLGEMLLTSARKLHAAGAAFVICPDNTAHIALERVAPRLPLPWLHIADAVGAEAAQRSLRRVGLLGTRFLVESDVYERRLAPRGVQVVRPTVPERDSLDSVIFDELCCGVVSVRGRELLRRVCLRLRDEDGCDGAILGCTELPLLVDPAEPPALPALDSTRLLARAAIARALQGA
jgi:aspartate racemase